MEALITGGPLGREEVPSELVQDLSVLYTASLDPLMIALLGKSTQHDA